MSCQEGVLTGHQATRGLRRCTPVVGWAPPVILSVGKLLLVENSSLGREEGSWCSRWSGWKEGGVCTGLWSRLMMAPCHCGRLKLVWFLALCARLEPSKSPLTAGILPARQAAEGPPRRGRVGLQSQRWALTKRAFVHPCSCSGGAQQSAWQPARIEGTVWSSQAAAAPLLSPSSCSGHGPRPSGLCSWPPVGWPGVREGR